VCLCESTQRNVERLSFAQSSKYGGCRVGLFSGELRGLGKVGFAMGFFFMLASRRTLIYLAAGRHIRVCVRLCVCVSV